MNFSNILEGYDEYNRLRENIHNTPISVAGLADGAAAQFICQLAFGKRGIIVLANDMDAKAFYEELKFFNKNCLYFPGKDYIFHNIDAFGKETERKRLGVLDSFINGTDTKIVTSQEALLSYTIPRERFLDNRISVSLGDELEIGEISQKLILMGYSKADMVEGAGSFSVRGGIIDVFSPNYQNPIRIEMFDTEVDSVRFFDEETQRSLENCEKVQIISAREAVFSEEDRELLAKTLTEQKKKEARKKEKNEKLIETLEQDIEKLADGEMPVFDRYMPVVYGGVPTLADYLGEDDFVFLIEPKKISERARTLSKEEAELLLNLSENGIVAKAKGGYFGDYKEIKEDFKKSKIVSINALNHSGLDFQYNAIFNFETRTTINFHGKIEYLYDDLMRWTKEKYSVIILVANRSRGENLSGTIREKGIDCSYLHDAVEFPEGKVSIIKGELKKGFEYPRCKFIILSDREIFSVKPARRRKKDENTNRLKSYTDINPGDYVVHQSHGIGQYMGLHKMNVSGITKDYLKIQYRGTDVLYVPVEQMNYLYKYIGSTDRAVKMNSLGGSEWKNTKAKVKKSTDDLAKQLVNLYAQREQMKGYAFSEDTPWQRDFEDTFIYSETDDQLRSIDEVKRDMEKARPMDRLLCGDVGYGKTEVALRAAFKAVCDSKQVAYLCPTTILAMQHYDTFARRMGDFPVKVEMLSRFRTKKQQEEILKKLRKGEIDILIGTHRILQKDVEYKDLGLLIIDEEQRFGVADKEKLKELKKDVDVLSMTATPIPRTLHMAMISVRDMSILEEPPENRYPVGTYVLEHDDGVIHDAIRKEISRGGQVFYLYNRVKGIYHVAERIKNAIPEARVAVGHGKMNEEELEDIMYEMVEGKCDVLVCTTIIETGLDIPNANTIIIENADRMGLSQLYQLRGRVGRSNRAAYAYLTYRRDGTLTDIAQKRLRAISEFTEFGSGFKIAMRDLEIRGAGTLLGSQQHGHMDSVGYDMYCKILKESVRDIRGVTEDVREPATLDIQVDAYIPERYIGNINHRVDMYKKISVIENQAEKEELIDELIDRFGNVPKSVMNLLEIAILKAEATGLGVSEITAKENHITFKFDQSFFEPRFIMEMIKKFPREISTRPNSAEPLIIYKPKEKKTLGNIKFILHELLALKNEKN